MAMTVRNPARTLTCRTGRAVSPTAPSPGWRVPGALWSWLRSRGADARRAGRQGGVGHRDGAVQSVDGGADLIEDVGQRVGTEPGEAAGGGQQGQPLVAGVGLLPVE